MADQDSAQRRQHNLESYHRRVAERLARGMCRRCGKRPPAPERSICASCGEKAEGGRESARFPEGPQADPGRAKEAEVTPSPKTGDRELGL